MFLLFCHARLEPRSGSRAVVCVRFHRATKHLNENELKAPRLRCPEKSEMSWLYDLKKLYSLDTLDARFVPPQPVNELKIDSAKASSEEFRRRQNGEKVPSLPNGAQPSRWKSSEFFYHYLIFIICVPLMVYTPYSISKGAWDVSLSATPLLILSKLRIHAIQNLTLFFHLDGFGVAKSYVII